MGGLEEPGKGMRVGNGEYYGMFRAVSWCLGGGGKKRM